MTLVEILICVAVGIVGIAAGIVVGILIRKSIAEKKLGIAEERAKKIEADAKIQAEADTNKMILAAQKEINQMRTESEREIKERRGEITRSERRLTQKEESLEKKTEALDKKDDLLNIKIKETEELKEKIKDNDELSFCLFFIFFLIVFNGFFLCGFAQVFKFDLFVVLFFFANMFHICVCTGERKWWMGIFFRYVIYIR